MIWVLLGFILGFVVMTLPFLISRDAMKRSDLPLMISLGIFGGLCVAALEAAAVSQ